jgi:hypothetical protein
MRSKDQILLENLYDSMSLHGWMDPNGKMISNQGYQRHLDTAIEILKKLYKLTQKQIFIEITPEKIFEYLFAKQWLRITYSGSIIYCNNTIRPPTQKQLNELKNLCIEFNKTGITWDNDVEDRVLWTNNIREL